MPGTDAAIVLPADTTDDSDSHAAPRHASPTAPRHASPSAPRSDRLGAQAFKAALWTTYMRGMRCPVLISTGRTTRCERERG
eukprot:2032901-Rhodomonas_salina.1